MQVLRPKRSESQAAGNIPGILKHHYESEPGSVRGLRSKVRPNSPSQGIRSRDDSKFIGIRVTDGGQEVGHGLQTVEQTTVVSSVY